MFRRENQRPEYFEKISQFLLDQLRRMKNQESAAYAIRLLDLALEFGAFDYEVVFEISDEIGSAARKSGQYRIAIEALDIALSAAIQIKDKELQIEKWQEIAECHIGDAGVRNRGIVSVGCLVKAIDALAKVPGTKQKRLELFEEMRDFQIESLHEMSEVSTEPVDISQVVQQSLLRVQAVDVFDALFRLGVRVCQPTNMSLLESHAKEQSEFSLFSMVSATYVDQDGMTTARLPGGFDSNGETGSTWPLMMREMKIDHHMAVTGQIKPAIQEVMARFFIRGFKSAWVKNPFRG